ncbi:NETO2 [Cordylochernes scorpioides]|uniref:NETO2 n=1 Tax=Cordylochernes scorpioides TaxID=51811 RepID=A0ABY6LTP9_9ARAC|nr:NETO2 [Cordylochernes scorpioides]
MFNQCEVIEKCNPDEFYCDDGTCIDLRLKCNGYYNCKYRYDEDDCVAVKTKRMELKSNIITILVVFFILLTAMCASIIVSCRAKLRERRQRIREYRLRKSRLSTIDHQREVAFESTQDGIEEEPEGSTYIPFGCEGSPVQLSVNSLVKHHPYCQKHRRDSMSPPIPPPPPPPIHLKVRDWGPHMDDDMGSRSGGMGFRTFRSDKDEESNKADLELKSLDSTPDIIVHR